MSVIPWIQVVRDSYQHVLLTAEHFKICTGLKNVCVCVVSEAVTCLQR